MLHSILETAVNPVILKYYRVATKSLPFFVAHTIYCYFCFRQVLEVMAAVRNEDITELANVMYENTERVFCQS